MRHLRRLFVLRFDPKDRFSNLAAVECYSDARWKILVQIHLVVCYVIVKTSTKGQCEILHGFSFISSLLERNTAEEARIVSKALFKN